MAMDFQLTGQAYSAGRDDDELTAIGSPGGVRAGDGCRRRSRLLDALGLRKQMRR
jgi:hypothetical protein